MIFNNCNFNEIVDALTRSLFGADTSDASSIPVPPNRMLTEDGFAMLTEDGDYMLNEG